MTCRYIAIVWTVEYEEPPTYLNIKTKICWTYVCSSELQAVPFAIAWIYSPLRLIVIFLMELNFLQNIPYNQTWKREKKSMNPVEFNFSERFFAKFVKCSTKFKSFNVEIRNNFKNIIFIACKWRKTCVNNMLLAR